ncbi:MAG: U32 family peptidase, partial [Clostridia bacterium]|nr:U32 family peptidase [Clostridia bacterium]
MRYCHLHGVRIYVTVNTLVNDLELEALSDYAAYLYKIGIDAVICADLGAIREIRRRVPDLEIHASTQMSVHNVSGAKAAYELGCTRVVPARELSLENIKTMVENTPTEIEIFLHGALCVCHSGQCLFSSLVGGRSGNRGECAQPCRLPYNGGKYPLSLKDLSLAEHIPAIIESGVSSLKIEGRMKSPEYVYAVTKIYRTLLDEGRAATLGEMRR